MHLILKNKVSFVLCFCFTPLCFHLKSIKIMQPRQTKRLGTNALDREARKTAKNDKFYCCLIATVIMSLLRSFLVVWFILEAVKFVYQSCGVLHLKFSPFTLYGTLLSTYLELTCLHFRVIIILYNFNGKNQSTPGE